MMTMMLSAWGETWEISGAKIELLVVRDNFGNPLHPEERKGDDDDFKEDMCDNYIGMSSIHLVMHLFTSYKFVKIDTLLKISPVGKFDKSSPSPRQLVLLIGQAFEIIIMIHDYEDYSVMVSILIHHT